MNGVVYPEDIRFRLPSKRICVLPNGYYHIPTARMTNNYQYSIKVNEALESYGARTHGNLARRVERLKRFTELKNRAYAEEIRIEHARMMANEEREERVRNRVREMTGTGKTGRRSAIQEVAVPTTQSRYNLRSRSNSDFSLNPLWCAIQNGFVNVNRG